MCQTRNNHKISLSACIHANISPHNCFPLKTIVCGKENVKSELLSEYPHIMKRRDPIDSMRFLSGCCSRMRKDSEWKQNKRHSKSRFSFFILAYDDQANDSQKPKDNFKLHGHLASLCNTTRIHKQ